MTFEQWTSQRQWVDDLGKTIVADENVNGPGYLYPHGCWVRQSDEPERGAFYVLVGRGDLFGTLADCERLLWDEHAKYEVEA